MISSEEGIGSELSSLALSDDEITAFLKWHNTLENTLEGHRNHLKY